MRILHLVKTGDAATWAFRQMRELVKLGVDVHVAFPPGGTLQPDYEECGVTTHQLDLNFPVRFPAKAPSVCRSLQNLVRDVRPDLIHSHFVTTTLTMRLGLGPRHPIPRVFQVPGPLHLEHAFFRQAEICVSGDADYWIGSCEWTCERYVSSGIPENRVFLSYYGTDLTRLEKVSKGSLRAELGLGSTAKIVGMVAFIYPVKWYLGHRRGIKGHEDLIDAIEICHRQEPDIHCVFIGGSISGERDSYEDAIRVYGATRLGGYVHFLGRRDDVSALYEDFDVAVHPSHSENVGGAGESLLKAVPTVATRVGGFPDIVKPGETGWLVPVRDPVHLAEAILEALSDPSHARSMANCGQRLARQLFDVRNTAKSTLQIYETILNRSANA